MHLDVSERIGIGVGVYLNNKIYYYAWCLSAYRNNIVGRNRACTTCARTGNSEPPPPPRPTLRTLLLWVKTRKRVWLNFSVFRFFRK